MAGLLGYLSILADDIGSLAGKTAATTAKSLATSLDDIGILFDDIATYTKLASIKSSGLLVDDLAAIANFTNETTSEILKKELEKAKDVEEFENNVKKLDEKTQKEILKELEHIREVAILEAKRKAALRELPIVYKIAKGSFINKFIIIPIVLLLSYIAPWAIAPILIIGGAYLAYEGVESILEKFGHHQEDEQTDQKESSNEDFEDQKVKSAIKTDFILSFEIIVISLSLLGNSDFITKLMVLISVGILTTVLVYGIVALIIKLDDIGFYLQEKKSIALQKIGDGFVKSMPYIIKTIGVLGTIAMLAVGGGIIAHETHILQSLENITKTIPLGGFFSEIILGAIVGYIVVLVLPIFSKIIKVFKK
jgi:predicted DNA repair protein MutK